MRHSSDPQRYLCSKVVHSTYLQIICRGDIQGARAVSDQCVLPQLLKNLLSRTVEVFMVFAGACHLGLVPTHLFYKPYIADKIGELASP